MNDVIFWKLKSYDSLKLILSAFQQQIFWVERVHTDFIWRPCKNLIVLFNNTFSGLNGFILTSINQIFWFVKGFIWRPSSFRRPESKVIVLLDIHPTGTLVGSQPAYKNHKGTKTTESPVRVERRKHACIIFARNHLRDLPKYPTSILPHWEDQVIGHVTSAVDSPAWLQNPLGSCPCGVKFGIYPPLHHRQIWMTLMPSCVSLGTQAHGTFCMFVKIIQNSKLTATVVS